ncbi:luciferin 4-monooxygenase-like [Phymastichus coffea]|uniref:luciferin 4-monooxygenase-like n=1 Tax=Phymastichus coffea TaxID=108790 RepID=UPI00273A7876|nr:luciferin 4-monooxygenase-like [Phymastichus coffea]
MVAPNTQLSIIDVKTNEKLGFNKVGELCVKTSAVNYGYFKNPVETMKVFDDEGWFHSGDEAYYDENGEIVIVGRMKDIIRYRDIDIHPVHVEDLLLALPDVAEAAVIGVPHEIFIERPVAFVKITPGSTVTKEAISKVAVELEYSDILEDSIEFIDQMPRNTNGKIDKKVLKVLAKKYYESSL